MAEENEAAKRQFEDDIHTFNTTHIPIPPTIGLGDLNKRLTERLPYLDALIAMGLDQYQILVELTQPTDGEFEEHFPNIDLLVDFTQFNLTPAQSAYLMTFQFQDWVNLKKRIPILQWLKDSGLLFNGKSQEQQPHQITNNQNNCDPGDFDTLYQNQNQTQWSHNPLYLMYPLHGIIKGYMANYYQWESNPKSNDKLQVEFKFIPIDMIFHTWYCHHYYNLLDILYLRADATNNKNKHVSYQSNGSSTTSSTSTTPSTSQAVAHFNKHYLPLLDDGTIPQLSSRTRLYFSTPHVGNGEWVQFHGPGTQLGELGGDPATFLTLGSLCPPPSQADIDSNKAGDFTSVSTWYHNNGSIIKSSPQTSKYQISIKWD